MKVYVLQMAYPEMGLQCQAHELVEDSLTAGTVHRTVESAMREAAAVTADLFSDLSDAAVDPDLVCPVLQWTFVSDEVPGGQLRKWEAGVEELDLAFRVTERELME